MKGILFLGCSFTWGQGLYFYSDLDTLIRPNDEYSFNQKDVSHAQIKYKNRLRFPRLVANHFKTFEHTRSINGGCEDHSFEFLDNLFVQDFVYEDFSYMIIQISHVFRNSFKFQYNGINYTTNLDPRNERENPNEPFYSWYDENNMTYDLYRNEFIKQQVERLKEKIIFYEDKGIKCKVISWQEEIVPFIYQDLVLNEKFVKLEYDNKTFDTISLLQKAYPNMTIMYDEFFGDNPPKDHHPSKLCHQVISNSIIKNIENNKS